MLQLTYYLLRNIITDYSIKEHFYLKVFITKVLKLSFAALVISANYLIVNMFIVLSIYISMLGKGVCYDQCVLLTQLLVLALLDFVPQGQT